MLKLIRLTLGFLLCLLISCDCDEIVECRGFKQASIDAFPMVNPQAVQFSNNLDSVLRFDLESYEVLGPYTDECGNSGLTPECICPDCVRPFGAMRFRARNPVTKTFIRQARSSRIVTRGDSTFRLDSTYLDTFETNFSNYYIRLTDRLDNNELYVMFELFGFRGFITMDSQDPSLYIPSQNDTILAEFNTPFKSYQNVYRSSQQNGKSSAVKYVYFSTTDGIIGFVDANTLEPFYRLY